MLSTNATVVEELFKFNVFNDHYYNSSQYHVQKLYHVPLFTKFNFSRLILLYGCENGDYKNSSGEHRNK